MSMMNVQCPPGAAAGSTIMIQDPSGQQMNVVVPDGVAPGMSFQVQMGAPAPPPPAVVAAAPQPTTMEVACPAGAGPGTTIMIQTPDGQQMNVVVPDGVQPGMNFQIQVSGGGPPPAQVANPMAAAPVMMAAGGVAMAGGMAMAGGLPAGAMNMAGITGAERLAPFGDLFIKQQMEMLEAFTGYETGNKYDIFGFVPGQGQTHLFRAGEDSDCCARQCGPCHAWEMKVFEHSDSPIFNIERPIRFTAPTCCCYIQELSVYDGNGSSERGGNMLGQVCQTWAPCGSAFDIIVNGSVVFKINGPVCICDGPCCGDQVFSICDPSGQPVAAPGSVCGQAEIRKLGAKDFGDMVQQNFTDADNFGCTFPPGASAPVKSVILSAVFLLDFMFFENNAGAQNQHGGGFGGGFGD